MRCHSSVFGEAGRGCRVIFVVLMSGAIFLCCGIHIGVLLSQRELERELNCLRDALVRAHFRRSEAVRAIEAGLEIMTPEQAARWTQARSVLEPDNVNLTPIHSDRP